MKVVNKGVSKTLCDSSWLTPSFLLGPPGNPLFFVPYDTTDIITLSTEVLAGLTAEQQTDVATQGNSWADLDALYTWITAQDWFNAGNVMGDNVKGVAFYDDSTTTASLLRYATWWPVTLDLVVINPDGSTMLNPDASEAANPS